MHPRLKIALFALAGILAVALLVFSLVDRPRTEKLPSWGQVFSLAGKPEPPASPQAVGVPLEPRSKKQQHTHAAFRLSASDSSFSAPENMGITRSGQVLAIHTHDRTGVVHLHRPQGAPDFTVSQVLSVWGLPVNQGRLAGFPARITVNGKPGSLNQVLRDRDDVVVYLPGGSRLPAFDWSRIPLEDLK